MTEKADVVVIGGGCVGCSIAYNLKTRGMDKVVLLEKNYVGSGTTGRSAGIVRQHYSTELLTRIASRSLNIIRDFERQIGYDSGYRKTGLIVTAAKNGIHLLKETVAMQRSLGVDTRLLSPSELKEIQPELYVEDLEAGAYEPDAGYADPSLITQGYAKAAKMLGAKVQEKTEVVNIRKNGNRVVAVETDRGEEISAPVIVNATNAWADRINEMIEVRLPIKSIKTQVVLLKRPPNFHGPHLVIFDFTSLMYMRAEGNTRSLVGRIRDNEKDPQEPIDPDNCLNSVDSEVLEILSRRVLRRLPIMEHAVPDGGWSGALDVTPDWNPILDQIGEVEGFYVAVGFSGHGFKLCPAVGEMMADLIAHGKKDGSDITQFRSTRFKEGKLIVPRYGHSAMG